MDRLGYWEGAGAAKTFTHPVRVDWLEGVGRDARVLDYGCGYGRVMGELREQGFHDLSGVDVSSALVERGRRLWPGLRLDVLESPPAVPVEPASFDLALLFAVLTCVPDDHAQHALVTELHRVLSPGGLLYVSDVPLQPDPRNHTRYTTYQATTHPHGEHLRQPQQERDTTGGPRQKAARAGGPDGKDTPGGPQQGAARASGPGGVGLPYGTAGEPRRAGRRSVPYGVFRTDDGAVCRHHEPAHLRRLLAAFEIVHEEPLTVETMNGHPVQAIQFLARKP